MTNKETNQEEMNQMEGYVYIGTMHSPNVPELDGVKVYQEGNEQYFQCGLCGDEIDIEQFMTYKCCNDCGHHMGYFRE